MDDQHVQQSTFIALLQKDRDILVSELLQTLTPAGEAVLPVPNSIVLGAYVHHPEFAISGSSWLSDFKILRKEAG